MKKRALRNQKKKWGAKMETEDVIEHIQTVKRGKIARQR